jgi:7-keto-8-aminopelargonate synthetase-like enzyme
MAIGKETKIKVMRRTKKIRIMTGREGSERRKRHWRGTERNHLALKYLEITMKKKRALILPIMIRTVNRAKEMEALEKTGTRVMTRLILKIWIFQLHLNVVIM